MPYDVLSQDMYDDPNQQPPPRRGWFSFITSRLQPFIIHILILILLGIGIFLFYMSDLSFDWNDSDVGVITILGDIDDFNHSYNGSLDVYSGRFNIDSNFGNFDGESKNIELVNFTGNILKYNKSIIFEGSVSEINYGKNSIKLKNENFTMVSKVKTVIDMDFDYINFSFHKGTVKLDTDLTYDLDDSLIVLKNFSSKVIYDGTFSLSGKSESFDIVSEKQNLKISYLDESNDEEE